VKVIHFDKETKEYEVLDEEPGDDEESTQKFERFKFLIIFPCCSSLYYMEINKNYLWNGQLLTSDLLLINSLSRQPPSRLGFVLRRFRASNLGQDGSFNDSPSSML